MRSGLPFCRAMNSSVLQTFLTRTSPPDLGPGPRIGTASVSEIDDALDGAGLRDNQKNLVRALLLLWNDHHDPAHTIVQDLETQDGSYIHAILHRREPDYFNAKYWFRRVGQHSCFPELAKRTAVILEEHNLTSLAKKLMPGGQWDSFAFVDACEAAASPSSPAHDTLRQIQQTEFEILLDHLSR